MPKVSVNAPKTPVTKGSSGMATATVPNVCKMPGPPAPFVPTPLPNIGQSSKSPDGYSTSVTVEGDPVAIQGSSFGSSGDIASKGTGGGIVSSNVEGPAKFVAPGSLDVKIEGKNVQLLGDAMTNNGGPGGSPPNAATTPGEMQAPGQPGIGGDADVACAIHCCDKKPYSLKNNRGGKNTCQRLACRKHSCVLHSLREKKGDKLTTKNKFENVLASPRCKAPGIGRTLIPDTIVDGKAIDAKFPSDPSKVTFSKGAGKVVNASLPTSGKTMVGDKELREYTKIKEPVQVKKCEAMTPSDAEARKKDGCAC